MTFGRCCLRARSAAISAALAAARWACRCCSASAAFSAGVGAGGGRLSLRFSSTPRAGGKAGGYRTENLLPLVDGLLHELLLVLGVLLEALLLAEELDVGPVKGWAGEDATAHRSGADWNQLAFRRDARQSSASVRSRMWLASRARLGVLQHRFRLPKQGEASRRTAQRTSDLALDPDIHPTVIVIDRFNELAKRVVLSREARDGKYYNSAPRKARPVKKCIVSD